MSKKKEISWSCSLAKKLLEDDLNSGAIPDEMDPKEVYVQRAEFSEFPYDRFRSNLRALRKNILQKKSNSVADYDSLVHDRKLYPKPSRNCRGEPRWEGSVAEIKLREDVLQGKHQEMCPKELYYSREEYYSSYPLGVFRKHIDQEKRRLKFIAYLNAKEEKTNTRKQYATK